jgi:hypothetical protein
VLLGARPEAPVDESLQRTREAETRTFSGPHRERVAAAGGERLGAAFKSLGELVSQQESAAPPPDSLVANLRAGLDACVEPDAEGKPRLTVTLPDKTALENLAQTLAKLLCTSDADKA